MVIALPWVARAVGNEVDLAGQISHTRGLYQPLQWLGATPPEEKENQMLLTALQNLKPHGSELEVSALEAFASAHAGSPWRPSIEANLGRYYADHGRFGDAIKSWTSVWQATASAGDGVGKQLADATFLQLSKLLLGLGKVDELKVLYNQAGNRSFGKGSQLQIYNNTRHDYESMVRGTDTAFRCGAYALNRVGIKLKGNAFDRSTALGSPSPSTGFSLLKLVELGKQAGLDLVAVKWPGGQTLVTPCVVHWKDNHYAAILAETNGFYEVDDTLFYDHRWLSQKDIAMEASGMFLVPKDKLPGNWTVLTDSEAAQVYGRGFVGSAPDPCDCGSSCCTAGSGGAGGSGGKSGPGGPGGPPGGPWGWGPGGPTLCNDCSGMPAWQVSEPQINLFLHDEPVGYQSALGGRISFLLSYKQRDIDPTSGTAPLSPRTISPNFFSVGANWFLSWLSYVKPLIITGCGPGNAQLMQPNGSWRTYTPDNSTPEYYSGSVMQQLTNAAGELTFIVSRRDGSKDCYGFVPQETPNGEPGAVALLSAQVDPYNHTNSFIYTDNGSTVWLNYVVDADGRTNTLNYSNPAFPAQITGVTDPVADQPYRRAGDEQCGAI